MNTNLKNLIAIIKMHSILVYKTPSEVLTILLIPLFFIYFISILSNGAFQGHAYIGALIFYVTNWGFNTTGQNLVFARESKMISYYVASPVKPIIYVFGILGAYFIITFLGLAIILILGVLSGIFNIGSIPFMLLILILIWISMASFGFALGSVMKTASQMRSVFNIVLFLMVFLPPVYYPLNTLAWPLNIISLILPTTNGAEILRIVVGLSNSNLYLHLFLLIIFSIFLFGIGITKVHWKQP